MTVIDNLLKEETTMDAEIARSLGFVDKIRYELYDLPLKADQSAIVCF